MEIHESTSNCSSFSNLGGVKSIMMNIRKHALWFGWIVPALLLVLALDGCASRQSGTYPTLKQTQLHVSWPMTRYRNAAAFGELTLAERQRMEAAYADYQAAFNRALEAAGGNYDAPASEEVKARANEVNQVLAGIPLLH
ncbi:MAG: hypothetical protein JWR69_2436 [Pedosphaera sp.]|nr:hypothetical protein [Pedosphaera sp.]